jgi:signal transduction histidine kinase
VGVPWTFFQILTYSDRPYPEGVKELAFGLATLLLIGNLAVFLTNRRVTNLRSARVLAAASLSLDVIVISGIVWLWAFDNNSALWAVLFILPLEGAMRFQLWGALLTWFGSTLLYITREIYGSERYDYLLQWNSVTFRMGIGLIIALVAGLMARDLMRQREKVARAFNELQAVDGLRSALVSTLAHDVRNPLTAIQGSIKTLLARRHMITTDAAAGLLESADRQADRLTRLANDLLDLARLEQGRMALDTKPVPLKHAVDGALSYLESAYRIETRIEPHLLVQADPDRLQQVLINVATNALRYGEAPFLIEAAAVDGGAELSFRDHGPGVPPESLALLFEPFGSQKSRGSVGFGLAIVKALVEAQGGRVTYETNRPQGACFKMWLPEADGTDGTSEAWEQDSRATGQTTLVPGKD